MSICINDDLIWVSVPKCASKSIEDAFYNSDLEISHYYLKNLKPKDNQHIHVQLNLLYNKFGIKETVRIKRNYMDRWISALRYFWSQMEINNIEPLRKWCDVDNDFIYEMFNESYINSIHGIIPGMNDANVYEKIKKIDRYFFKNIKETNELSAGLYIVFYSQMYWTNKKNCTYEFEINEIDKFEKFISDRYNIEFKLKKLNQSSELPSKIIKDDQLKNWIFDNFEKRFITKTNLI